jgi:hypothetical protein
MKKLWIVTTEINAYDQEGEYFYSVFTEKPTFQQLKKLIGADDVTIGRLTRGGGRLGLEHLWYNLHEVEEGVGFVTL